MKKFDRAGRIIFTIGYEPMEEEMIEKALTSAKNDLLSNFGSQYTIKSFVCNIHTGTKAIDTIRVCNDFDMWTKEQKENASAYIEYRIRGELL